jgi:hypothetical protein
LTTESSCWGELSSPADKGTVSQYNGIVNSGQLNMTLSIKIEKKERKVSKVQTIFYELKIVSY